VDDDESISSTFTRILRKSGYNTNNARSAEEAFARLDDTTYDVVLIDLRIPEADGMLLLKKMSKKDHDMVKILITDFPTEFNRRGAMQESPITYVKKPVKPERPLKLIGRKLESKRVKMES
jgi:DNA-binding NtrC family response regulator